VVEARRKRGGVPAQDRSLGRPTALAATSLMKCVVRRQPFWLRDDALRPAAAASSVQDATLP